MDQLFPFLSISIYDWQINKVRQSKNSNMPAYITVNIKWIASEITGGVINDIIIITATLTSRVKVKLLLNVNIYMFVL